MREWPASVDYSACLLSHTRVRKAREVVPEAIGLCGRPAVMVMLGPVIHPRFSGDVILYPSQTGMQQTGTPNPQRAGTGSLWERCNLQRPSTLPCLGKGRHTPAPEQTTSGSPGFLRVRRSWMMPNVLVPRTQLITVPPPTM